MKNQIIAASVVFVLGIAAALLVGHLVSPSPAAPAAEEKVVVRTEYVDEATGQPTHDPSTDVQGYTPGTLAQAVTADLGTSWDVTFTVASAMKLTNGAIILNDTPYNKLGPKGRSVFVPAKLVPEGIRVAAQLKGKRVRILGVTDEFRERQLQAESVELLP